jgi:hypothetical protein
VVQATYTVVPVYVKARTVGHRRNVMALIRNTIVYRNPDTEIVILTSFARIVQCRATVGIDTYIARCR